MERYSIDCCYETIRDMGSNEKVHLDNYLGDVVLEITKDARYDDFRDKIVFDVEGKDAMNFVTVEFKLGKVDGKTLATTNKIRFDELEDVLNDIRDGDTTHLIDEDKPLGELVKAAEKSKNKVDRDTMSQGAAPKNGKAVMQKSVKAPLSRCKDAIQRRAAHYDDR